MFQRSPTSPPPIDRRKSQPSGNSHNGQFQISSPSSGEKSVIGNDLKIIGQGLKIISRGMLQVDGVVEGDVQAAEVVIGEQGKVTGMVAGTQVVVRGKVDGIVCGKTVAFQASSEIKGDIHHMAFSIEQGAIFEGRSRRAANESALNDVIDGRSAGADPAPTLPS